MRNTESGGAWPWTWLLVHSFPSFVKGMMSVHARRSYSFHSVNTMAPACTRVVRKNVRVDQDGIEAFSICV
jgi:hypothetical protein